MRYIGTALLLLSLLPLAACKDGYLWPDRDAEGDAPEALTPFATADELETHLKRAIRAQRIPAERGEVVLEAEPRREWTRRTA